MERFGRVGEGSQSDPSTEWTTSETRLEESVWQSGLEDRESLPERPGEPDCLYFLRTGSCGYGPRCRFNHPPDRGAVISAAKVSGGDYPDRAGHPVCQYFMKMGTCKFGASCKYHHPRQGVTPVLLNCLGYPCRPGEKECTYFVKTGQCKFGASCKFDHPVPAGMPVSAQSPAAQGSLLPTLGRSSQQYGVVMARQPPPPLVPGPYVQGHYGPMLIPPGMVLYPGWSPYLGPVAPMATPNSQATMTSSSIYGMPPLSPSLPAYAATYQPLPYSVSPMNSQKEHVFPDRPGQPECQHYMRTGDCKFGSSCRYHHPPQVVATNTNVLSSPTGLPIRPDAPTCIHYAQHGVCKFGLTCKYDHPMAPLSYSTSASSLADLAVAPYPVPPLVGTTSVTSGSLPLLITGSGIDSSSIKTTTIPISSSVSDSNPQQPSQNSVPPTGNSGDGKEGDT